MNPGLGDNRFLRVMPDVAAHPSIDEAPLISTSPARAIIIVLDGVGCGELPDAARFGDAGSNTLGNLSRCFDEGLTLPNLARLGLGNILPLRGVAPMPPGRSAASFGRCAEISAGKDSTTGHWEMAGLITPVPFPTYPHGFPPEVIAEFERRIGRGVLGNRVASGTEIVAKLGAEHLRTGRPIVYTSADSVFQIAAHETVYPVQELYRVCEIARDLLRPPHGVSRVIARPFTGEMGAFKRTADRRDFSIAPQGPTLLDRLNANGIHTLGIGKIGDLFAHRGLEHEIHTMNNDEGIDRTLAAMAQTPAPAFIFCNLVDFDQQYGHRNDPAGFRAALQAFDSRLPEIEAAAGPDDLLILTADHGNDPTTPSTDHSREYIPLLVFGHTVLGGVDLGIRSSLADIGQTVAEYLSIPPLAAGTSFLGEIKLAAARRRERE